MKRMGGSWATANGSPRSTWPERSRATRTRPAKSQCPWSEKMKVGLAWPLLVMVAVSNAATASSRELQFDVPAQGIGNFDVSGLQWALIVFSEASSAEFDL